MPAARSGAVLMAPLPDAQAAAWLARLRSSAVRHLSGVAVVAVREPGRYLAERAGEAVLLSAPRTILATGARELFLPFPGWTLPAVLGVGGAQALLKSGASFAGLRVVVAGTGPLLLPVAASLAHAGARIRAVAEQAGLGSVAAFGASLWRRPSKAAQAVRYRAAFAACALPHRHLGRRPPRAADVSRACASPTAAAPGAKSAMSSRAPTAWCRTSSCHVR